MSALAGGYADPARQASFAFRSLLTVMSRPGKIETLKGAKPPAPLSTAAGVLALTLCDPDTPLYLAGSVDTPSVREWLTFHTGAPLTGPEHCMFAIGDWAGLAPLERFPLGTPEYPDRSATLIVEVPELRAKGATLSGPGIRDTAAVSLPEVAAFQQNATAFPLGLDFFFTCGADVAGLPRTTKVT